MIILDDMNQCTGCTACESICPFDAIAMTENELGFFYPLIDTSKCVECGLCRKTCPINQKLRISERSRCFGVINNNKDERLKSSSGGVFPLLAKVILGELGIVYGATYNDQDIVEHIRVSDLQDLPRLQGAKYTQSNLHDTFMNVKTDLENGKKVLFSGIPCEIGGLKSYLKKDYDNLLTVDLVCHGVPSPKAWKQYLKYRMEKDHEADLPRTVNLRNKDSGWSKYNYSVEFSYDDKAYKNINGNDPYMTAFVSNKLSRPSCENCHFKGIERCSDLTLGDFWGIWDIDSQMDDNMGTSLVITHTQKGLHALDNISEYCKIKEYQVNDAVQGNPSIVASSAADSRRNEILKGDINREYKHVDDDISKRNSPPGILKRLANKLRQKTKI